MNKKSGVIIMIIAVALVIAGALISVVGNRKEENPQGTVGNTAGNLYNSGYFCESTDGYVYFANAYDGYALYRMKPDESEMERLVLTEAKSINTDGRYYYYYQNGSGNGTGLGYMFVNTGVFKGDPKSGKGSTTLEQRCGSQVLLVNNEIYYTSEGSDSIMSMELDGSEKTQRLDFVPTFSSVVNDNIYFTDGIEDLYLKAYNTTNGSISQVLAQDVYMPIVDGNTVYCIDVHGDYALVSYDLSTGEKTTLDSTRTDIINVSTNYVYYQTSGDNPQLKRCSKATGNIEVVADGVYSDINITSRYVYFHEFNLPTPVYKVPVDGNINVTNFENARQGMLNAS